MSRRIVAGAVVVLVEGYLYWRYRASGAQFHFWLHGLFGAALAAFTLTVIGLARRSPARPIWRAGLAGHAYAAGPDLVFLTLGIVHQLWMDAFAFHITIHLIPAPLATMFAVFTLSLLGWAATTLGRWRIAALLTGAAVAVTVVAFALRAPLPRTLDELRADPGLALICPLAAPPPTAL